MFGLISRKTQWDGIICNIHFKPLYQVPIRIKHHDKCANASFKHELAMRRGGSDNILRDDCNNINNYITTMVHDAPKIKRLIIKNHGSSINPQDFL